MSSSESESDRSRSGSEDSDSDRSDGSDREDEKVTNNVDLSDKTLSMEVVDPVKQGDGIKAYVTYTVKTTSDIPSYNKSPYKVVRRYNDFVWLYEQLTLENEGYIIPPLPEKMAIGRFSAEFIEARRRGLEIFLNAVGKNLVLKKSKILKTFLTASGSSFAKKRDESKLKLDAASASKVMSILGKSLLDVGNKTAELAKNTVNQMTGQGRQDRAMSNEDMEFITIAENIRTLAETIVNIRNAAEIVDKRQKELYDIYNRLSCDLSALAQSDESDAAIAYAVLSGALHSASNIQREYASKERFLFLEPFKQYVSLCESAIKVIKLREIKAHSIEEAREELLKAKINHNKASGTKRKELERTVKKCKKNVEKTIESVEKVTDIVKSEIRRFNTEKMAGFKETIVNYIILQKIYDEKFKKIFDDVIPDLEEIKVEELSKAAAEKADSMITVPEEEPEKDEDKKRRERRLKRKEEARKAAMKKREKEKSKSKKSSKGKSKSGKKKSHKKKESSSESESEEESGSGSGSGSDSD